MPRLRVTTVRISGAAIKAMSGLGVALSVVLAFAPAALAHHDPSGCFGAGVDVDIFARRQRCSITTNRACSLDADCPGGETCQFVGLVGALAPCETIFYEAILSHDDDPSKCAFEGGTFTLRLPDGSTTVTNAVPCLGGTLAPCISGINSITTGNVPYTVRPADLLPGTMTIRARAIYTGGLTHDGGGLDDDSGDTPGTATASLVISSAVVSCDDNDVCTTDVCDSTFNTAAACKHTDVDCNDDNACTTDACGNPGGCTHVAPDPTCVPCDSPADCNDDNACTTDLCTAGICGHETPDPTCVPCKTPADCNDDNACTTDLCTAGICGHETPDPTCIPCDTPADCNDSNACTTDLCTAGICGHETPDPTCIPCDTPADCNDDNACSVDHCIEGICRYAIIDFCIPCASPADCNDDNACTSDLCTDGVCAHQTPDPTCVPCSTPTDCNDHNACTNDLCTDGICGHVTPDPTCVPCETSAQCNDDQTCTTDACTAGKCTHAPVPNCPPETCTDGIDNDGDGDIDCADPDCKDDPGCKVEICGNCRDDDGDDLIDYEDADCCDNTSALVMQGMAIRTKPVPEKNRLRIKAQYAPRAPAGFDPGILGTTLQIRDDAGTLFCQNIPFKSDPVWTAKGVFMFVDKAGTMASGLRRAKFKILSKKDGRLIFKTRGKKMSFREPVGTEVLVTVRVGDQCTQATTALRTRRAKTGKKLVFP